MVFEQELDQPAEPAGEAAGTEGSHSGRVGQWRRRPHRAADHGRAAEAKVEFLFSPFCHQ